MVSARISGPLPQLFTHLGGLAKNAAACRRGELDGEELRKSIRAIRSQLQAMCDAPSPSVRPFVASLEPSPTELGLLLLAASVHLAPALWNSLMFAQGSVLKPYLTFGFALSLVQRADAPLQEVQAIRHGLLFRSGILELHAAVDAPTYTGATAMALVCPSFSADLLLGHHSVDLSLQDVASLTQPNRRVFDLVLTPANAEEVGRLAKTFAPDKERAFRFQRAWCLGLSGDPQAGKSSVVEALATSWENPLLSVSLPLLAHLRAPDAALTRVFANGSAVGALVHLRDVDVALSSHPQLAHRLVYVLERYRGPCVLERSEAGTPHPILRRVIHHNLHLAPLGAAERAQLWESAISPSVEVSHDLRLDGLAAQWQLSGQQIRNAAAWGEQMANCNGAPLCLADLEAGARAQTSGGLDAFTEASRVRMGFDELILAPDPRRQLMALFDACKNREHVIHGWGFAKRLPTGKGIVALFSGEAGTGKTLSAEILASELNLPLHRVAIPSVVSKWVGETEKNVREIFRQARAQEAILLFDEADALFGKRLKVDSAQAHFQNMEVNNLLQEIERYEGIVLLTTNLEGNMDDAFQRRILFKVHFEAPETAERAQIWRSLIPKEADVEAELDFERLANAYPLTGGQIKNAIVQAAYACASEGSGLTMEALHDSGEAQTRAAGKLVNR